MSRHAQRDPEPSPNRRARHRARSDEDDEGFASGGQQHRGEAPDPYLAALRLGGVDPYLASLPRQGAERFPAPPREDPVEPAVWTAPDRGSGAGQPLGKPPVAAVEVSLPMPTDWREVLYGEPVEPAQQWTVSGGAQPYPEYQASTAAEDDPGYSTPDEPVSAGSWRLSGSDSPDGTGGWDRNGGPIGTVHFTGSTTGAEVVPYRAAADDPVVTTRRSRYADGDGDPGRASTGYGSPAAYDAPDQYGAGDRYGAPDRYGEGRAQRGESAGYGELVRYSGPPPQRGEPVAYGQAAGYDVPGQRGEPVQYGEPVRYGESASNGGLAPRREPAPYRDSVRYGEVVRRASAPSPAAYRDTEEPEPPRAPGWTRQRHRRAESSQPVTEAGTGPALTYPPAPLALEPPRPDPSVRSLPAVAATPLLPAVRSPVRPALPTPSLLPAPPALPAPPVRRTPAPSPVSRELAVSREPATSWRPDVPALPPPSGRPEGNGGRTRLRINPITCAGHGLCAELLPELIELDDWGYPGPTQIEIPRELEQPAQQAVQACPTLAIILERKTRRNAS